MKKLKIDKGLIVQKIDKDTIIFDSSKSTLYTFNNTASFIFDRLKKGFNKEKIISAIIKNYNIKKEKAEKDYDTILIELKNKKIIE